MRARHPGGGCGLQGLRPRRLIRPWRIISSRWRWPIVAGVLSENDKRRVIRSMDGDDATRACTARKRTKKHHFKKQHFKKHHFVLSKFARSGGSADSMRA